MPRRVVAARAAPAPRTRSPTPGGGRPDRVDDELARLERRQEMRDEEVLRRDLAPPARTLATTVPPRAARQSGSSAARVGVGDRAADRAAVAGRRSGRRTAAPRPASGRRSRDELRRRPPPGGPARRSRTLPFSDLIASSSGDPVQVDEHASAAASRMLSSGDEALAAGERLRVVAACASAASASSTLAARTYSNGGGFTRGRSSQTRAGSAAPRRRRGRSRRRPRSRSRPARSSCSLAEPFGAERRERRRRLAVADPERAGGRARSGRGSP